MGEPVTIRLSRKPGSAVAGLVGGRWGGAGQGGFGGSEQFAQGVHVIGSSRLELGPAVGATRAEVGLDGVHTAIAVAFERLDQAGPWQGAGAEERGLTPHL